jgi:hypothetical protein
MSIDTTKVTDRRVVLLRSLSDLRAEAQRMAAADRAGRMRTTGNWTTGQCLHHLAVWMNAAFDGPPGGRPPLLLRLVGPLMKPMVLRGLRPGMRIPRVEGGTYGIEVVSTDSGERELLAAIERMERGTPPDRSPVFGRMSKEDWISLHLRHAELHCSFFHPR